MAISNVAVTANTAVVTVSTTDLTNVSVTQTTSNISVGSATIIANSDIRAALSVTDTGGDGSLSYDEPTGVFTYTGPSASEVRSHLSVTDTGGDGSLSYDNGTGIITYTGPSAAEVRAHLGNTDPILYDTSTGVISLNNTTLLSGQTTDNLTQGSTNLYFSNALARNAIISGIGIDYNNVTGEANVNHIAVGRRNNADNVFLHDDEILMSGGNWNTGTPGLRGVKTFPRNSSSGGTGDFLFTGMYVKDVSNVEDGFPVIGIGDDISAPGFQFVRMAGTSPESITQVLATFEADNTFLVSGNLESNSSLTVAGDIVGGGNLEITGNINYREVEDLLVRDQEIYLNFGNASAQTSTIYVDRSGSGAANTFLRWNESSDKWQFSNDGSNVDNIGAGTSTLGTIDTGTFITGGPVSTGNITIDLDTSATDGRYTKVITAGNGLSGAGTAGDVTLNVGAGDGITVAADTVALNVAYTRNQFSATGSLAYDSGTGEFSYTERSNSDILNLVDEDFASDASIHKIAKLRGTEFKIASNATNLAADIYSYAFPDNDGANGEALITDGNGTLSFGTVATTYGDANVEALLSGGTITGNITTTGNLNGGGATLTGVLTSDSNITTTANIQADYFIADTEFIGDLDGAIAEGVYNDSGVTLTKGMAVYITGSQGDEANVAPANSQVAANMPAMGIIKENISAGASGQAVTSGTMNFSGHGFTEGAELYVSTDGTLTETKPSGESNLIQKIAKALSPNFILVQGAGRTNATPNLNDGNFFLGNASNQAATADFTDETNTAIGAYTGGLTNLTGDVTTTSNISANNIALSNIFEYSNSSQTGTVFTHYSGNVYFAEYPNNAFEGSNIHIADKDRSFGLNTQMLKIGQYETSVIPHVGTFYSGPGIITENLHVEKNLNFAQGVINLNLFADGSATLGNADYKFSDQTQNLSNVYINIGTGNVDGTANTVVGIKTNLNSNTRLGWHDPISRSTYDYQSEPVFDPSTAPNGWYAFGDLAKTTVDETFDANLTISGHTSLKGFNETVIALGSQSGNIAALAEFNAANGSIFTMTATGGIEISQIPNATAGSSYTLKITQDGTGSHALTSTFKYQGGDKTLTTAGGNTDVISVVYDGTDYLATLSKDYY
jgi:hypothetical protein